MCKNENDHIYGRSGKEAWARFLIDKGAKMNKTQPVSLKTSELLGREQVQTAAAQEANLVRDDGST